MERMEITKYPGWVTDIISIVLIICILIASPVLWIVYLIFCKKKLY